MAGNKLLIVDDEANIREGLAQFFTEKYEVFEAATLDSAKDLLATETFDAAIIDLRLSSESGLEVLKFALEQNKSPVCVMITAYGDVDSAVAAMRAGAYHYVAKPLKLDELEMIVERGLRLRELEIENASLRKRVDDKYDLGNLIGKSKAMRELVKTIKLVAPTRSSVLLEGESGTGKELIAHAIHRLSGRPWDKFVIVHCAALSPQLLESELFGHEKGSFTGAAGRRIGRFEQANDGGIFLDEIGEINGETQVKLLRAIGERVIERVGGNQSIKIDARIIAATNKNLNELVAEGRFREDLYYRLSVIKIRVPPLRERMEDVPLIAAKFLREVARENSRGDIKISEAAFDCMMNYHWPGNVRELRAAVERGVTLCESDKILPKHLPESVSSGKSPISLKISSHNTDKAPRYAQTSEDKAGENSAKSRLYSRFDDENKMHDAERRERFLSVVNSDKVEIDRIIQALEESAGNRTLAAEKLGISRRTLQRKIKAYKEKFA